VASRTCRERVGGQLFDKPPAGDCERREAQAEGKRERRKGHRQQQVRAAWLRRPAGRVARLARPSSGRADGWTSQLQLSCRCYR